jgi:NADPH2:quinone reductase
MRRVVCTQFGPADGLALVVEPDPEPGAGQVVVAVEAAGVSFVDGLIVEGGYQVRPPLPFSPGSAVAGTVAAVGAGVTAHVVGDRVTGLASGGGYTTHAVLAERAAHPLPVGIPAAVAATALESYCTLLFAVEHRVRIAPGAWVLVLGAGGGIGLAAIDVARSLGARVIAVASSEQKRAAALAAGAEHAVGYDDLKNEARKLSGGGVDIVIDPVGGPAAESALRALGEYGRYCVLGFAAGEIPRLPANIVLLRNRSIIGVDWGDWARTRPGEAAALVPDLLGRLATGELRPPTPATYPLADAGRVLGLIAARAVTGKVALVP